MSKINASVVEKVNEIKKEYYFKYNQKATQKLAVIDGLIPITCYVDGDKIIFCNRSKNMSNLQVTITDRKYNLIDQIDMSKYKPWRAISLAKYQNRYIACGVMDSAGFSEYIPYIFSEDLSSSIILEDEIPFFKDRQISAVVNDDKGGMYFLESYTGFLHYMDNEGEIDSFKGSFKESFQALYFNETLYITDLFLWMRLKQSCNVLIFRDNEFAKTSLTGEAICFSPELNCFFTASSYLDSCIKKYSADGSLVFSKDFAFSKNQHKVIFMAVNKNHLLLLTAASKTPLIYDIY